MQLLFKPKGFILFGETNDNVLQEKKRQKGQIALIVGNNEKSKLNFKEEECADYDILSTM